MEPTTPDKADSPRAVDRPVGVPRQYGVGTMLTITAIYGVLFAFLTCVDAHPAAFVAFAVFLAGVGAAQMLLFQGTRPREASLLAGSCLLVAAAAVGVVMLHVAREPGDGGLLWAVVFTPAIGAGLGYLVGGAIAGPFLIAQRLRDRRKPAPEPRDDG